MAKLSKILENKSFQGFALSVLLIGIVSVPYILAQPHLARLENARELCRAYGGAVWVKPYPQLAGVRLIPLEKEVCANLKFRLSLKGDIEAALSAE